MTRHIIPVLSIPLLFAAYLLQSCNPSVPSTATPVDRQPKVSPDYTDLDIPQNIAPLNFCIDEKGEKYVTRYHTAKGTELIVAGKVVDVPVDDWHSLLATAHGDTVYATVYMRAGGVWQRFAPIKYFVAEAIDPYVSYRHIEPLYMTYDVLNICQRDLTNYEVHDIYNNCPYLAVEGDRQCMNCHSYQDYNRTGRMQMHVRVTNPGTVIVDGDDIHKVNLKVGDLYSPGAYCSWHPTLPLIAYSINDTWQHFHSVDNNKVEVQDAASGLILYDVDSNEVSVIQDSPTELETFPYWSPDGRYLYYVSAQVPNMTHEGMANYRMHHYRDIKYDIYRRAYDARTRTFGDVDTVFMASRIGMSATFPRESPDGRYLLFTMGEYGTFHNFHHDADLYLMDLNSGRVVEANQLNSQDVESYHSFSSNGRWVIFSSRRDNGSYTRLYIAHFGEDGRPGKPFLLPQQSPFASDMLFKSYNLPEFMVKPVDVTRQQWLDAIDRAPVEAIMR